MTSRPRRNGTHRNGGGRPKIDWAAARRFFMRDPTVGYGDVARRFGVSETAVRKHASPKAESWEQLRADFLAEIDERERLKDIRTLEERRQRTIEVAEKLRDAVLSDEALVDVTAAVRALPRYAKLEELFAGEATDRISLTEVNEVLAAYREAVMEVGEQLAAGDVAPAGFRSAFLEALRRRVSEVAAKTEEQAA